MSLHSRTGEGSVICHVWVEEGEPLRTPRIANRLIAIIFEMRAPRSRDGIVQTIYAGEKNESMPIENMKCDLIGIAGGS
jgi:hypothetical protein